MQLGLPCTGHGRRTGHRRHYATALDERLTALRPVKGTPSPHKNSRNVQASAAQAHGPSTELVDVPPPTTPPAAHTATLSPTSVFSYLGLGSRNSDSIDTGAVPDDLATRTAAGLRTGRALLRSLQAARDHLGTSLEQLIFDGASESMPGWDVSQVASVLMTLGLLRRRPDDEWLAEFWSASLVKLRDCSTADLAMISLGVSELQLQPPQAWREALLAVVIALAEEEEESEGGNGTGPDSAAGPAAGASLAAADAVSGVGPGWAEGSGALAARLQAAIGAVAPGLSLRQMSSQQLTGPGVESEGRPATAGAVPTAAEPPPSAPWLPGAGPGGARVGGGQAAEGAGGAAAAPPPRLINSAYDMEEMSYGGMGPERSSGIAELLLQPLQVLWGGARAAVSAASASFRRQRSSSELVTAVYNLTAAGWAVDAAWMRRYMEAMGSRLGDLSGDDLHCLLVVAAEEVTGSGGGGGSTGTSGVSSGGPYGLDLTPEWQAKLFARMDGVTWALQESHLVGCLSSIATLGLRPPPPWVRRQLLSLQLSLPALPTPALVQLGALLPALPLYDEPAPGPSSSPSASPSLTAGTSSSSVPAGRVSRRSLSPASLLPKPWRDAGCVERWMADYRAAVAGRHDAMTPAELLAVISGVSAATALAPQPPASGSTSPSRWLPAAAVAARAVAGRKPPPRGSDGTPPAAPPVHRLQQLLLGGPGGSGMPYAEWRRTMVSAVAARLPEASLTALCESWQVLADAEGQRSGQARAAGASSEGEAGAGVCGVEDLLELRALVASRLAATTSQLGTSDVAPVLSSLAAAGLPLPAATLDALLASMQPLLPGLSTSELVTVALSLVRLSYKPNLAWQTAFCAASRRRLGLMTPGQRCSLLVASASLGLHLPDPWLQDFFAVSERGLVDSLDGPQLANLLWAVSCVAPEPPGSWLEQWEGASMGRLRELGPNMLAVVLKAMATLHHRPSLAWQSAFFAALQRRLFAAGATQLTWPGSEPYDDHLPSPSAASQPAASTSSNGTTPRDATGTAAASTSSTFTRGEASSSHSESGSAPRPTRFRPGSMSAPNLAPSSASPPAEGLVSAPPAALDMLSSTVTLEALNSLVYSLASLDLHPPVAWLDELMDAVRCKLSLLSTLDMSVVLAFLVARSHRPSDEWWDSFLEALESRFHSLSASEMASLLIMLNALKVSPAAQWLDAFCTATEARLSYFQPSHLLQVLSCLHLFRHRPGQTWMSAYTTAVEAQLPRFSPTELARVLMLLDHLNQRPSAAFMLRFYDFSRPGLALLDAQELVNVAWAVVSCATLQPDLRWVEALVEAARPRVPSLQQPQLRVLVAALGHMQRGVGLNSAENFLALAREFLVL